jgi:Prp8 binding protein
MSVVKRHRPNDGQLIAAGRGPALSTLLSSPTVQLSGHEAEVLAVQFDPTGEFIASSSSDKTVFLWKAKEDNGNFGVLKGHKGAVLDVKWSRDSRQIFTASSDLTIGTWDLDQTGERTRKHTGHTGMVNCIDIVRRGVELIVSGSDDGSVAVWDPREKSAVTVFTTEFPIMTVAVDSVGSQVFSSGVDNEISVWDARKNDAPLYKLAGHNDANVTGLDVSADDNFLVSNGMDNTVRTWNIRPFASDDRALNVFDGAPNSIEQNLHRVQFNHDATRIAAGSGDRTAVIWDSHTRKILYKLEGHIGSVNDVCFSPEGLLASGSSDRTIILYELS